MIDYSLKRPDIALLSMTQSLNACYQQLPRVSSTTHLNKQFCRYYCRIILYYLLLKNFVYPTSSSDYYEIITRIYSFKTTTINNFITSLQPVTAQNRHRLPHIREKYFDCLQFSSSFRRISCTNYQSCVYKCVCNTNTHTLKETIRLLSIHSNNVYSIYLCNLYMCV